MPSPTPFHNTKAESTLVGTLLVHPRAVDEISQDLRRECFYDDLIGSVFAIIREMRTNGVGIDPVTVVSEIDRQKLGEQMPDGAPTFVMDLIECDGMEHNAPHYANLVVDCWRRRLAFSATEKMKNSLKDASQNLDETLGICGTELRSIEEACLPKSQLSLGDMLVDALDPKNRCSQGVPTGFDTVDEMTGGLHPQQLIVVAARTTIGKSAFAGNVLTNFAERGDAVFLVTLEMSQQDFIYRLVARLSGLSMKQIRSSRNEYHAPILDAMNMMNHWPIFIDDTVPQTVSGIGAKLRSLHRKHNIKLVIVDYLQLIQPSDRRIIREQQIASITRELKMLAKQTRIPIVALSQLNRNQEKENRMPRMSDIRESGCVEQDSDGVWLIHRPGFGDSSKSESDVDFIIAKNRQGERGIVKMEWDGSRFQFREKEVHTGW